MLFSLFNFGLVVSLPFNIKLILHQYASALPLLTEQVPNWVCSRWIDPCQ